MHLISCTGICWQTFNHRFWSRPLVMPWRLRVFQLVGRVLPSFMVNINKRSFPNNVRHVIGCFHGSFQSQCGLKIRWKAIWYLITVDHKFNARFVREGFYYDVFIFPYLFRAVDQDKNKFDWKISLFYFYWFFKIHKSRSNKFNTKGRELMINCSRKNNKCLYIGPYWDIQSLCLKLIIYLILHESKDMYLRYQYN